MTMGDNHSAAPGFTGLSPASCSHPAGGASVPLPAVTSESQESTENSAAQAEAFNLPDPLPKLDHPSPRKMKAPYLVSQDSRMDIDNMREPSPFTLSQTAGSSPRSVTAANSFPMRAPEQGAATALGKHTRPQPDLVEQFDSRPTAFHKRQHKPSHQAPTAGSEAMARVDKTLAEIKDLVRSQAELNRMVAVSQEALTMDVALLNRRLRDFEKDKEEALAAQRRQLRPGLVTMKMTPRVQGRVNQLFGSTGNGAGPSTGRPAAQPRAAKNISRGAAAKQIPAGDSDATPVNQGATNALTATRFKGHQMPPKADPSVLPPVGFFRTEPRKYPTTSNNVASGSTTSRNKASSNTMSNRETSGRSLRMKVVIDDSEEEGDDDATEDASDVPTESSYQSSIPA